MLIPRTSFIEAHAILGEHHAACRAVREPRPPPRFSRAMRWLTVALLMPSAAAAAVNDFVSTTRAKIDKEQDIVNVAPLLFG